MPLPGLSGVRLRLEGLLLSGLRLTGLRLRLMGLLLRLMGLDLSFEPLAIGLSSLEPLRQRFEP